MRQILILLGVLLIAAGLLWPWLGWAGHLPGDIIIRHKNFTLYFPLVTGIVVSIVLSLLFWFISR